MARYARRAATNDTAIQGRSTEVNSNKRLSLREAQTLQGKRLRQSQAGYFIRPRTWLYSS